MKTARNAQNIESKIEFCICADIKHTLIIP